jgi:hypothetical protein
MHLCRMHRLGRQDNVSVKDVPRTSELSREMSVIGLPFPTLRKKSSHHGRTLYDFSGCLKLCEMTFWGLDFTEAS